MHVVVINGSPRDRKFSNTEKILDAFIRGMEEAGASSERYAISNRKNWEQAREAYCKNTEILIAIPLYVECIPGLLLEFLETLPKKEDNTRISFILQGGFAEASQLRCGEEFLEKLPGYLGANYGGSLVKGDNFGIRVAKEKDVEKMTKPYQEMGKVFVRKQGFFSEETKKFSGPEYFSLPLRMFLQVIFCTIGRTSFKKVAKQWGAKVPLNYRPWS